MTGSNKPFTLGDWILIGVSIFWVVALAAVSSHYSAEANLISLLVPFGLAIWFAKRRGWIDDFIQVLVPLPSSSAISTDLANRLPPVYYTIQPGKKSKWEPHTATAFVKSLLSQVSTAFVEFSIEATHEDIRFTLLIDPGTLSLEAVRGLVHGLYPGAEVSEYVFRESAYPLHYKQMIFARSRQYPFFESLKSPDQLKTDPLATLTQVMDSLQPGESLTYTLSSLGSLIYDQKDVKNLLTVSKLAVAPTPRYYRAKDLGEQVTQDLMQTFFDWRTRVPAFSGQQERDYRSKLTQPLSLAVLSVMMQTPEPERLNQLSALIAIVGQFNAPDCPLIENGHENQTKVGDSDALFAQYPANRVIEWSKSPDKNWRAYGDKHVFYLTTDEIASLWHLPHEAFSASHIGWGTVSQVPLPKALMSLDHGLLLGINRQGQRELPVYLPDEERTQHIMIVGKPGTGKSSLLHRMIHEDIAHGLGICVIDPHGTLVRDILQNSIPQERQSDVVVLDFANEQYPPPLNPLYHPPGLENDIATGLLMAILTKMYSEFADKEMADTMQTALLTLATETQPTLLDVERVFDNPDYRDSLLAETDDFTLPQTWTRFDRQSMGKQEEMKRPVLWRLNPFIKNRKLRPISCHPKPLDLRQLMAEKRIILVSLAADDAKIPEEQRRVLGAVLVSQIQMAAMAGAISDGPFILYIDEAEHFTTTALSQMLSEARKRKLGLVLANQYFKQLAGDTLNAVEGTVGTFITFEVGEPDAKVLLPYLKPQFDVTDLVALGKYRAAVWLRYNDQRQPAFTLETQRPPHPETEAEQVHVQETEGHIRQLSIEKYTPMTYSEVEAWLKARYNPASSQATVHTTQPDHASTNDEFIEPKA